jgi:hypothetical protein
VEVCFWAELRGAIGGANGGVNISVETLIPGGLKLLFKGRIMEVIDGAKGPVYQSFEYQMEDPSSEKFRKWKIRRK